MSERNPDSGQQAELRLTCELRGQIERLLPKDEDARLVLALLGAQHIDRTTYRPWRDMAELLRRVPERLFTLPRRARG